MISDEQLKQYDEQGFVTIDTPFSEAELDRAEAAWDRLKESGEAPYDDPDYVDVVQHPFFEEVAQKVRASGHPIELESLSAAERRQIHTFLKEARDLETFSQGQEPDRRLVVRLR